MTSPDPGITEYDITLNLPLYSFTDGTRFFAGIPDAGFELCGYDEGEIGIKAEKEDMILFLQTSVSEKTKNIDGNYHVFPYAYSTTFDRNGFQYVMTGKENKEPRLMMTLMTREYAKKEGYI